MVGVIQWMSTRTVHPKRNRRTGRRHSTQVKYSLRSGFPEELGGLLCSRKRSWWMLTIMATMEPTHAAAMTKSACERENPYTSVNMSRITARVMYSTDQLNAVQRERYVAIGSAHSMPKGRVSEVNKSCLMLVSAASFRPTSHRT